MEAGAAIEFAKPVRARRDARDEALLVAVLRRGPATWTTLFAMGFDRDTLLHAVGLVVEVDGLSAVIGATCATLLGGTDAQ
jgi:hypothetical protein